MSEYNGAIVQHRIYGEHRVLVDNILSNSILLEHTNTGAHREVPRTGWLNDWAIVEDVKQIGGTHYKDMGIDPWKIIDANGLDFYEGNALKYLLRYKNKNGVEDLKKAIHYIEHLIERLENA